MQLASTNMGFKLQCIGSKTSSSPLYCLAYDNKQHLRSRGVHVPLLCHSVIGKDHNPNLMPSPLYLPLHISLESNSQRA